MPVGSWINADIRLPIRAGNVLISETFFLYTHVGRDWDIVLKSRPELWEKVCNIVLERVDFGKYKYATVWRVFQNHMYAGWYMSICHPHLPEVNEGCELSQIDVNLHSDELYKIQQAMCDFFMTLPTQEGE